MKKELGTVLAHGKNSANSGYFYLSATAVVELCLKITIFF